MPTKLLRDTGSSHLTSKPDGSLMSSDVLEVARLLLEKDRPSIIGISCITYHFDIQLMRNIIKIGRVQERKVSNYHLVVKFSILIIMTLCDLQKKYE